MQRLKDQRFRFAHFAVVMLAVLAAPAHAAAAALRPPPPDNSIPTAQRTEAIAAATQAVQSYIENHGDFAISVSIVAVASDGYMLHDQPPLAQAISAEVESQLATYTGNQITILSLAMTGERADRILAQQNISQNPSDTFAREVAQLAAAPYLITIEVGPPAQGVQASAGPVVIRVIETATSRVLNTISSQFYEDRAAFPNINQATWVQHSVTYWMNEMMGWNAATREASGGLPQALSGPYLLRLQFTGEIPRRQHTALKEAIADACGIENARTINLRSTRENGLDVAAADLRIDVPPHFIMDDLVIAVQDAMQQADLTATPLRESSGDVIFAISNTPAWWALTDPAQGNQELRQQWAQALKDADAPGIAVVSSIDPAIDAAGEVSALGTAIQAALIDAGAQVVGVEPADMPYHEARLNAPADENAFEHMLPQTLKQRARWALFIEAIPGPNPDDPPRALARLVDLHQDRVLAAAAFPDHASAVPPGQQTPDANTHAARYLVGSVMADVIANPRDIKPMDVAIVGAPDFAFANRVSNIIRGRDQVADVVLPDWDGQQRAYTLQVRYRGDPGDLVERMRADLSTLPLQVGQLDTGRITLVYTDPANPPAQAP